MRDVVVIGGGLSGLAAAYELEKRAPAYTVIELKRGFGGSIRSSSQAGFILDASAFVFRPIAEDALPPELCLREQFIEISAGAHAFAGGTSTLVDAYARRLRGGRLMRMAVSSIGRLRGRFSICLENGLMLDAGALVLAVPAPYAARMLWNLAPEAARQLADFRYDSIWRVSLGYPKRDLPEPLRAAPDDKAPFILSTDNPARVPDVSHRLIQAGLRCPGTSSPSAVIRALIQHFGWGEAPIAARADYWAEADLLSDYDAAHRERVGEIRRHLPPGVCLAGSDYCLRAPLVDGVARLDERIQTGRQAARIAAAHLEAKKP